jgi:hypothetical protein
MFVNKAFCFTTHSLYRDNDDPSPCPYVGWQLLLRLGDASSLDVGEMFLQANNSSAFSITVWSSVWEESNDEDVWA